LRRDRRDRAFGRARLHPRPGKGISTSLTSSSGLNDLFQSVWHAYSRRSSTECSARVRILLRSPAASIGVSLAYFIAIEAIIVARLVRRQQLAPDHLLNALVHGGNGDSTYYQRC